MNNPVVIDTCPICGTPAIDDITHKLNARYYPPRKYWVIEHLELRNGAWMQRCAQAGYTLTFTGIETKGIT